VLVDKPEGPTSHDIVQRVRRAYGTRAVGHTGTLDPFATGLLVVLLGRATRLARFVEAQPKRYLAVARLGVTTETDDPTGAVTATHDIAALEEAAVRDALLALRGEGRQRPPVYSAKRVQGERSYDLARRGAAVELARVPVTVHDVALLSWRNPELRFRVTVSPGTYIRALARDLGERLGVGAHLSALRREAIGPLSVDDAVAVDALDQRPPLLPPVAVLSDMPRAALDATELAAVRHGRPVALPAGAAPTGGPEGGGEVALVYDGRLVAVAALRSGTLHPIVVLEPA
jgi:tRNA pseudouridine55 synthase